MNVIYLCVLLLTVPITVALTLVLRSRGYCWGRKFTQLADDPSEAKGSPSRLAAVQEGDETAIEMRAR